MARKKKEAEAEVVAEPVDEAPRGRHAAHAVGSDQGVHLKLGHMLVNDEGVAEFHLAQDFVIGWDEALALAEELPGAAADHGNTATHTG